MIRDFVKQIPTGSKVAIFGAGIAGCGIKQYLEENRKDIKLLYFFDSFVKGEKEGLKIIDFAEIENYQSNFDILICATRNLLHEIKVIFEYLDISYIAISPYIEQYFRLKKYIPQQELATKIFSSDEDKNLYNLVWQNRLDSTNGKLAEFVYNKHNISPKTHLRDYGIHYLEHINKNAISTIVDAGFCNGIHSLMFKKEFKNLKTLYAFEPTYNKFKNRVFDKFIKEANFCKMIELGLWEKETELVFAENSNAPSCSRVVLDDKLKKNETLTKIKTTTIDLFRTTIPEKIDLIKMDIEGAEFPALKGGIETIKNDRPQLAISIYHSLEDLIEIPLFLNQELKNYTFKLGHYSHNWAETVLYAIPNEIV